MSYLPLGLGLHTGDNARGSVFNSWNKQRRLYQGNFLQSIAYHVRDIIDTMQVDAL